MVIHRRFCRGAAERFVAPAARAAVALVVAAMIAVPVNGQTTVTWNGSDAGNANWSVAGNWSPATTLSGSVALVFGSGGSATTSFNDVANLTVTSGTISGLARTITGSAITLGGNITHSVAGVSTLDMNMSFGGVNRGFAVNSGTLIVNGTLSNSPNLIKNGTSLLRVTAANTTTGLLLNAGTLEAASIADTGLASSIGTGAVVIGNISGSGTLRYIGEANASTNKQMSLGGSGAGTSVLTSAVENNGAGTVTFTNAQFNTVATATWARVLVLGGTNTGVNEIQGQIRNNSQPVSLSKNGSGRWVLSGVNTYTGSTSVTAGTLQIGPTGSINSTSAITLNGATAELRYNSATALAKSLTLTQGTLSGTGTIASAVTANSLAAAFSPGNSPGIMPFGTSQAWESFTYLWETNDFLGTTAGTHFDQITIAGSLALTGSAGSYLLDITSLTSGNIAGDVGNFSDTNRSWTILTTTGGISGFDPAQWTISTANFTSNPAATGSWSISNVGSDLVLNFVVVPEPATLTLACMGAVLAGLAARRRRSPADRR
jgi:autotransporter-associated beta strand protein